MFKRVIACCGMMAALALTAVAPLRAQGTTGLEFLTVPMGARPVAMGGAYAAAVDGLDGLLFNPAALAGVRRVSLSFSQSGAADLFNQTLFAVGIPIAGSSALGLAANVQTFDPIPLTDLSGQLRGEFAPQTLVLIGSFGVGVTQRLHLGASVKWIYSELAGAGVDFLGSDFSGDAEGFAFDFGLLYSPDPTIPLRLGVAILDMGPSLRFNREDDKLPTRVRVGLAAEPLRAVLGSNALGPVDVLVVTDAVLSMESDGSEHGVLNYGVELNFLDILSLRAGVPGDLNEGSNRTVWWGLGLKYGGPRIGIARRFIEHPALGQETHLSLDFQL